MQPQSTIMCILKGIGYIVLGNIMCLFMTMGLTMFGVNIVFNVLAILCGTLIFYMLMFTVAWQDGDRQRVMLQNKRIDTPTKHRWIFIGILLAVIAAVPTIVLLLNKLLFPETDTLYLYPFLSGSAYPYLQTFVPTVVTEGEAWAPTTLRRIDLMSPVFPALMLIFYAIIPAVTQLGYYIGLKDMLNKDKIMYK